MSKTTERRWFVSKYVNTIRLQKFNERNLSSGAYFDSWQEAHADLRSRSYDRVAQAEKELQAERRRLKKVQAMTEPVMQAVNITRDFSLLP